MKLTRLLNLKFPDQKMEMEYISIKNQNSLSDLKATIGFMIVINLLLFIPGFPSKDWKNVYVSGAIILMMFFLFLLQGIIKKHYSYLTLIALFVFGIGRLVLIALKHSNWGPMVFYVQGYFLASIQSVVVSRVNNLYHKIYTMCLFFGARYGILLGVVDKNFNGLSLARYIVIDVFLIYMFYANEKSDRRVFQNFFENRDELMKFKDLLADSFPQSVAIMDLKFKKQLFVNNAFIKTFSYGEEGIEKTEIGQTQYLAEKEANESRKPKFELLKMDPSTLREIGSFHGDSIPSRKLLDGPASSIKEVFDNIVQENLLQDKALSITASSGQGKRRTFDVTLRKIKWYGTEAVAVILNDITMQENLIKLKIANTNKDHIIATVSHELRTPLHGIIGLLEVTEGRINDSEVLRHLSFCKDNAYLLLSLVNSLLDLQQISIGKLRLNPVKVEIKNVISYIVNLFQFQCNQKNIVLEASIDKEMPAYINTDENRLKQILINLVGNAIKFTFRGGVKIKVTQDLDDKECLRISVHDTGIGIKEEDKIKLFKMYGRLAEGESVNEHGVGLGLTISNKLVELLGGKNNENGIEVNSTFGVGTEFSFKILKEMGEEAKRNSSASPKENRRGDSETLEDLSEDLLPTIDSKIVSYNKIDRRATQKESSKLKFHLISTCNKDEIGESKSSSNKKFLTEPKGSYLNIDAESKITDIDKSRSKLFDGSITISPPHDEYILVVDDNPFNILVAKSLIKDLGYKVEAATGGQEAIEIVKTCFKEGRHLKIIFMDCQMPLMDGYTTTKLLKSMMERDEIQKVPIYAWTANNGEQDIRRCYESGMTGYLSKPTTKAAVMKSIPA